MLFQIEANLVYYGMLFFTILAMPIMYYCFRIISRILSYKAQEASINQCAKIFKDNEQTICQGFGTVMNLVDRVENHCYDYYRTNAIGNVVKSVFSRTFVPVVDMCKKYLSKSCKTQAKSSIMECPLMKCPMMKCPAMKNCPAMNRCPAMIFGTDHQPFPMMKNCATRRAGSMKQACPDNQFMDNSCCLVNQSCQSNLYDSLMCNAEECYVERNPCARPISFGYCPGCPFGSSPVPLYGNRSSCCTENMYGCYDCPISPRAEADFCTDNSCAYRCPSNTADYSCCAVSPRYNSPVNSRPNTPDFALDGCAEPKRFVDNDCAKDMFHMSGCSEKKREPTNNTKSDSPDIINNLFRTIFPDGINKNINNILSNSGISAQDYAKYANLFMDVCNKTVTSPSKMYDEVISSESDGIKVINVDDIKTNNKKCEDMTDSELMADTAKTFDDESTVSSIDFSKISRMDAMNALLRLSNELGLDCDTRGAQMFDSSKFTPPNQKVADFLRLACFVSSGSDQFNNMYCPRTIQCNKSCQKLDEFSDNSNSSDLSIEQSIEQCNESSDVVNDVVCVSTIDDTVCNKQ